MGNWMERVCMVMVVWVIILAVHPLRCIHANPEVDALSSLKGSLSDPNNVLQTWDPLADICTWFHVTCNSDNRVIRVDLGNSGLTGQLVPELGQLTELQYFRELYRNHIGGGIPKELGNLANLISLDLYFNSINGPIPDTFGKLSKLKFLSSAATGRSSAIRTVQITHTHMCVWVHWKVQIPSAFCSCRRGYDRRLNNNQLTGNIPVTLTYTTALQVL
ncbi:hypothetical protein OROGR_026131 [Orobanche gracilis]